MVVTFSGRCLRWLALPPLLGVAGFVFFIMPFERVGRPSMVARGQLSCGEVMLTQTFTGTSDPYVVLFYFRPSGAKQWIEFYVDDESPYWRGSLDVESSLDRCVVTFYRKLDLSYRCNDRTLTRRNRVGSPPRGLVSDPLLRNYEEQLDAEQARAELVRYAEGPPGSWSLPWP